MAEPAETFSLPPITALVCTRNRGGSACATVASLLANRYPDFRVIVVDQSDDTATEQALAGLAGDGRVCYLHDAGRGVSRARNLGLRRAVTEVVVSLDDDCEAPVDMLERWAHVLSETPQAVLAFCHVEAAPYDAAAGFTPAYAPRGTFVGSHIAHKNRLRGIGAGMALRRDAVLAIGGFDEMLGPGSPLDGGGEEGDLAVRALLRGLPVMETDRVWVRHHGFRAFGEGRELARRDWRGIGAAYAKPLRCGYWQAARVPAYEFVAWALWPPLRDLLHLRRPAGLMRVRAFLAGFAAGWRIPIDRDSLCFVPPAR